MDVSEREYGQLEAAPVDGTAEPAVADAPEPINVVSDEIEVATEEEIRRVIEEEGKVLEPEIALAEHEGAPPPPGEGPRTRSYISDHPTNFDWRPDVARLVNRIQKLRKEKDFNVTDRITVTLERKPFVERTVTDFKNYICAEILADRLSLSDTLDNAEVVDVNDSELKIVIQKS